MKRIFIVYSKWSYHFVPTIQNRLKQLGYEAVFHEYFDDTFVEEKIKKKKTKEENIEFCQKLFKSSQEKVKNSDITLVINLDKYQGGVLYKNYIGSTTFLNIYDSYKEEHPILLYNDIPEGILHDELEGMNPTILDGNLFKIFDHESFDFISKDNNLLHYFNEEDLLELKSCDDEYLKAAVIVRRLFKNKVDKSGKPYIGHLMRVSDSLDNYNQKVAGLLHDVVEDTEVTCKDLLEVCFSKEIIEIVYIVTKPLIDTSNFTKDQKLALYNREITEIILSDNDDAIKLKEMDMKDNYDPKRLEMLPQAKQEWFHEKYGKQLIRLKNENEKRKIKC